MIRSGLWYYMLLGGAFLALTGCSSMLHELKPHRLERWSRGPAPSRDPNFTHHAPLVSPVRGGALDERLYSSDAIDSPTFRAQTASR